MMQSEVRFLHEREGVRMSREVLEKTNWPEAVIAAVGEIIDGHDTRPHARSLNDRVVRDADKLWRFTVTGVAVACDWFKMTPANMPIASNNKFPFSKPRQAGDLPHGRWRKLAWR